MAMSEAPLHLLPEPGSVIGDQVVTDGTGGEYQHIYAATGRPTRRFALAGMREVDMAVAAARAAFPIWSSMRRDERRRLFLKAAEFIRRDAEILNILTTLDAGVPKSAANYATLDSAEWFEYHAGCIDRIGGEIRPTWPGNAHAYTLDEPYSVIGAITPFNAPMFAPCMMIAPVLAAGNTVVAKLSRSTPFVAVRLGQMFLEAGFPPGTVNLLTAAPEAGNALVRHPGVDKIFFEGSTRTAKSILIAAAESGPKPVALELGGKSPSFVFADADIDPAVEFAVVGGFALGGQSCASGSRLLVQASIYDEFVEKAAKAIGRVHVGDPLLDATTMGPLVSERECQRVMGVIAQAVEERHGRLVAGGQRLGGEFADGCFLTPTVFADVDNTTSLAQEEIFGPVLCILRFETEEEAIQIANDSPYGLSAYIRTNDLRRAHRMAQCIEAGMVNINGFQGSAPCPSLPFGGVKRSGNNRVGGTEGIREFTRTKTVTIMLD